MNLQNAKSLRDRLLQGNTNVESKTTTCEFMPYTCISSLLDTYELLKKMKVSKAEVHKCITHMITHRKKLVVPKPSAPVRIVFDCDKGVHKFALDYKQGFEVCTICGTIANKPVFGEQIPMCVSEEDLKNLECGTECDIPQWMMAQNSIGTAWYEIQLNMEIDHWNKYVNLGADELSRVKEIATWMKDRASDLSRIAAAFLFRIIEQQVDFENLDGKSFPIISYQPVVALQKCNVCEEEMFSKSDIRRHICYKVKKTQRQQWSLVKNKATKISTIPKID